MTASDRPNVLSASQHLLALVASSQDAIITKTLDGIIQSWNPAAERIFGYGADEIIGKSILLLIPEERQQEEEDIRSKLRNRERVEHYETIRKRKDGSLIEVSLTISPLLDDQGNVVGGSKIARDVTERKRADEVAYHFGAIVESSQDAIISKSLDGIISSWNPAAEKLFGYRADEIIGKPVLVLIPKDRQYEETEILQRIRAGERVEHFETVRQHKDGSPIDISLTISPVRDAAGRVIGASKIARDIRDKRRATETRELLLNEIKHRVKNTLGTVQAVAVQTFKSASPEEHQSFVARLHAMAAAHDLLTQKLWQDASITEIVDRALKPFGEDRLVMSGPVIDLNPSKTLLVAMLLHELGTNAVKYGALSNDRGRVNLTWDAYRNEDRQGLRLIWKESGGPAVAPPTRKGFGSRMIERALSAEGGASTMKFEPGGLVCEIEVRL